MSSGRTHTAEFWADKRRALDWYTVKECRDVGDSYEFSTTDSTAFVRSKTDVGEAFEPGDTFALETVNFSLITGLMDSDGVWRFRMTDEDLAEQARRQSQAFHDRKVVELEKNKAAWWAIEESLPEWIRARINHFRNAAGEKFLLDGWGYELAVAQLAVAYADRNEAEVDRIAEECGTSGNQHDMAKLLAQLHTEGRDADIANSVSALAPLTGSADYS
ncbi:hypothetical protein PBI_BLUEBERRY_61 [Gordonia phage Blueberry]|uniref:Uncharacterized protein n=1 Tax=Gordonia phage Azula TaxID=2762397 RepID=A0A7G8LKV1_9CAUD|nr:hypothetical protein BH771_gp61 [Gordonia phage Blueberry]YP_010109988.1 hypothetical protein KNV23_gp62 [Gordonia phage Azula]ANA85523.1 hypothetical protein PBI_BLUEBERRY_61 [Gordonia phage Blueberry]QGJ97436.1 hypothetical protein SEA_GAMBINO_64 [Gordonia phage Gambino]QNJ57873.1 hypothetical protein SEA_AZULA_62 [Gordonia phage Azula]